MHKNSFSFLEVTIHSIIRPTKPISTPYGLRFKTIQRKEGPADEKQQTFLFFLPNKKHGYYL